LTQLKNNQLVKVAVLGASGYLGGKVCEKVNELGLVVIKLGRTLTKEDLSQTPPNLIIDAAFPTSKITKEIKFKYLQDLSQNLEIAINNDLRYLYLGSYSSHPMSRSKYGRLKQQAERMVLLKGANILRVGLVIDPSNPKGRYYQVLRIAKSLPFTPVLPENWCPIYTTTLTNFNLEIDRSILNQNVNSINYIGIRESINLLLQGSNESRRKCIIPASILSIGRHLSKIIPLGPLDFVKSILYKEEKF